MSDMNGVSNHHRVVLATALVEADRRRADEWRRRRTRERPIEPEASSATESRLSRIAARLRLRHLILGGA
jgi:hypothetical protein